MAYIEQRLPVYYATLQKEYGLSYTDIQGLDKNNRVYVLEIAKADTMKDKGYSTTQILDYYKKQGYNATQLASIENYLNTRTVKDTNGQTGQSKLYKTVDDIQKVSGAVLPIAESLAKIFGIGGNSLNSQINIPNLSDYKAVSTDGYTNYKIDPATGKILEGTGVDVTPPKVNVSSLPFGLSVETLVLILLFLIILYLYFRPSEKTTKGKK